jgi:hypothetical protein
MWEGGRNGAEGAETYQPLLMRRVGCLKSEKLSVLWLCMVCVCWGGGGETDECKPNNKYNSMCHCCRHAQEPDETKRCSHKFSHRTPLPYTQRSAR